MVELENMLCKDEVKKLERVLNTTVLLYLLLHPNEMLREDIPPGAKFNDPEN
ncbi:hypothetical protein OL548_20165 [Lysinibacillus sp. MHQ-1]|nr:hypothetical protein OL548_20165 [Lysinibacillus sp. MHQ-1]